MIHRLIIFRADRNEIDKYRQLTQTQQGESFYRVANARSVPSSIWTISEHYDSSGKPIPEPGYRLTETVPEHRDYFRDNGWEVVRVETYTPDIPAPYGAEFEELDLIAK